MRHGKVLWEGSRNAAIAHNASSPCPRERMLAAAFRCHGMNGAHSLASYAATTAEVTVAPRIEANAGLGNAAVACAKLVLRGQPQHGAAVPRSRACETPVEPPRVLCDGHTSCAIGWTLSRARVGRVPKNLPARQTVAPGKNPRAPLGTHSLKPFACPALTLRRAGLLSKAWPERKGTVYCEQELLAGEPPTGVHSSAGYGSSNTRLCGEKA
eukprot:CAMPEP_0171065870 /NCGR_PEP_ID=MMETSP0766_2-20121228/7098_1 /TAXON_ID=439317 /ORGANISM="Gambierdiscus australes, Strain CAWD 149" /LENGTH=211 /DNA_ID=CAMNT_0011522009 /DNA_START=363 /DNA_END=999 /DNA_ORIENTATION=+